MATITGNGVLLGTTSNDAIIAGAGLYNDVLIGDTGSDTLSGGDGNDILAPDDFTSPYYYDSQYYSASVDDGAVDSVDGGAGFDLAALRFDNVASSISVDLSDPSISRTIAGSTIVNVEQFQIVLGSGSDTLTLGAGNDVALGQSGNDTLNGGQGSDQLLGGIGNDTLNGDAGNDYLRGEDGDDTLNGGDDNDNLFGNDGDDTLAGGAGTDWLDGGAGNDTAVFSGNQADYTFAAYQGWVRVTNTVTGEVDYVRLAETIQFADGSALAENLFTSTITGTDNSEGLYGSYVHETINAGGGDDYVAGYEGNDVLNGEGGNDYIDGGPGDDTLSGGDGDDYLNGGTGNDTLDGGDGVDRTSLQFQNSATGVTYALNGGPISTDNGTKTLTNFEGADMSGSQYNDTLTGGSAQDYLYGAGGNDTLNGLGGADYLDGGQGNDTLSGGDGDDYLSGSSGDDTLTGGAGTDRLEGGDGNDTAIFSGNQADYVFEAYQGSVRLTNTVTGEVDYVRLVETVQFADGSVQAANIHLTTTGTGAQESLYGSYVQDTINGGGGNDYINGYEGNDVLNGEGGNDQIYGGEGNDTLSGGDGDDWLDGGTGNDTLDGGDGVDRTALYFYNSAAGVTYTLNGGPVSTYTGTKTLTNFEGADMYGSQYNDTLTGGSGTDNLYGNSGNDTLSGLGGDDWLDGGQGNDTLDGGDGVDRTILRFDNAASGVTYTLNGGPISTSYGTKTLTNFEGADMQGSQYNDTLTGGSARDNLYGGSGNDTLNGLGGDDYLDGGQGDDTLSGGDGDDFVYGGSGTDTLDGGAGIDRTSLEFYNSATGVNYTLNGGPVSTYYGTKTLSNFEGADMYGSQHDDTLTGGSARDYIYGGGGVDTLNGLGGDDRLFGSGASLLNGGAGNDELYGDNQSTIAVYAGPRSQYAVVDNGDGTITVTDGSGSEGSDKLYSISFLKFSDGTISMADALSDEPAVAQDDAFTTSELNAVSGNLFADNGSGADSDPDGPALSISEVNGNAANVGMQITLASGALLTVNANGTFSYNPNGAFQYTPTPGSGASNTPSHDSFTYTLAGGDTATVSLTITGVDNNDLIIGTANNDTLTGGQGSDTIYAGDGNDTLRGNGGADTLYGENGNDFLNGGNGNDIVNGGAGFDRAAYFQGDPALGGINVSLLLQGSPQNVGSQGMDTLIGIEAVSGTPFADTITGDGNDNWLWGSVSGLGTDDPSATNNDTIDGGGGNDLIQVGAGNHLLTGGSEIDSLLYSENGGPEVAVSISLALQGAAQDTGAGSWNLSGFENISGGTQHDQLGGDGNANVLAGNAGDDTLEGGGGNDKLYGDGTIGLDTSGSGTFGFVTVNPDIAAFGGVGGNDTLDGGDGNDQLYGGGGDDWLTGGTGDDLIDGGLGQDTANYRGASGAVTIDLANGTASGAEGNDTLTSIEYVLGSGFDDLIYGDGVNNLLNGSDGNDTIYGGGGVDTLMGGDGNDQLHGEDGDDGFFAGPGDDLIDGGDGIDIASYEFISGAVTVDLENGTATGADGNDTLIAIENVTGTAFNDVIIGNNVDNFLRGEAGNDELIGGLGDDRLDGGEGQDLANYGRASGPVFVNLAAGTASGADGNDTLISIEDVQGSRYDDQLTGDDGGNVINAGLGNDLLVGAGGNDNLIAGDGNDTLRGGDGDDHLLGGTGNDLLDGGAGIDTANYAAASGGVSVFLYKAGNGNGEASGADGDDTLQGIENLLGSAFNDQLGGNNFTNVISGNDGHDVLRGNGGNDSLYGGNGDDFLNGGAGDDYIDGGAGFDRAGFYEDATSAGVTVDLNYQGVAQNTGQGMDTLVNIEHVSGSKYGDHLTGDNNNNLLWGSASTLTDGTVVTTNNDTLDGGGGNDVLQVGIGNHSLTGGSGVDTVAFTENGAAEPALTVSLALQGGPQATGAGNWTLNGIENLSGGINNDILTGDGNANVLAGNTGNDTLIGGAGNDTLYGDGLIGWDTHGSGGSGPITTFSDATLLDPAAIDGNDTLEGGLGDDQLYGGGGNDTASYANAAGSVQAFLYNGGFGEAEGADGYDQLHDIENLTGSAFNDLLFGNNIGNVLTGGEGHDTLRGLGGSDTLYGGGGDDLLYGNAGNDYMDGGAGFDRVGYFTGATAGVTVDLRIVGVAQNTGQGMDTLVNIEAVTGSAFSDTLIGDDANNWLGGQSDGAADTIWGNGGDDLIVDGIGDHVLDGGTGVDVFAWNSGVYGGLTISLAQQGVAQNTGGGNITLTNFESLSGSTANDTLTGDGNANVLGGDLGDDTLVGGAGNDSLYGDGAYRPDTHGTGGSGPITLYADATGLYIGAVGGNDTLEGGLGDDQLYGGGGNDTASYANATGGVQAFLYNGGFGEAEGADGYDQLHDIENLTGSAFNDMLFGNNQNNVLSGGDGIDMLRGNAGNDTLLGGGGNDYLDGGLGDDTLNGGDGWDRLSYFGSATGPVTVDLRIQGVAQNTGQGMDTLIGIEHTGGTIFNDTLIGNDGANWLRGSSDSAGSIDTLDGQGGDDLISDGAGDHNLTGGTGIDTFDYETNGSTGINVSLALQGAAQNTGVGMMTLSGFENLSGNAGNDTLTGDGNANVLAGDAGNDILIGGAGNDSLYGDGSIGLDTQGTGLSGPITLFTDVAALGGVDGNDTLEGGLGNDLLNGGGGIDTASYAHASAGVTVDLGDGTASGADGNDTLVSIENVIGSGFDDDLSGEGGANVIDAGGGNDFIAGAGGNDTIYGGDGNDFIQGDFGDNNISVIGNDTLYGGNGNDGLRGGAGNDMLYGGDGNDLLRGNSGVDYFDGGADDGEGFNGIGDRVSFYDQRATQGVVADLRTGIISNDGFGNVETMVGIESLGAGTAYADILYGNDARNFLAADVGDQAYGFGGDDIFQLTSAPAIVDGGSGVDRLTLFVSAGLLTPDSNGDGLAESRAAATAGFIVNLTAGTITDGYGFSGTVAGIENVDGTILGDTLIGDAGVNILNGLEGNDTLEGRLGNDILNGGTGIDTATYANASARVVVSLTSGSSSGADGNDSLVSIENVTGSGFDDSLTGDAGINLLNGGAGHDLLAGLAGNDSLAGGTGDDVLFGGAGDDLIDGGAGFDRAGYGGAASGVTVNLNLVGAQNTGGGGIDTLVGIEHVSGTQFGDTLTGDNGDNWLWGASGNDTISGGGGNDLIQVGAGTSTLSGGTGTDTLSFWSATTDISSTGVAFSLASQGAAQNTRQGMMNASGFENVSGSRYDDVISGDIGNNILLGDTGSDTLNGNDGNDTLYGDGRILADTHLYGTSGPIALFGDAQRDQDFGLGVDGNDTLNGGKGDDTLYGGRGNDILTGGPGADKFVIEAQSGADRITDFAHVDRIVFDPSSGVTAFSQLTFTLVGKDTVISWGNANSITVEGFKPKDLTAADFTFGPAAAASSFSAMSASSELSRVISATSNAMLLGSVAAVGLMSAQVAAEPLGALEQSGGGSGGGSTFATTSGLELSSTGIGSGTADVSRFALGGESREALPMGLTSPHLSHVEQSVSLDALGLISQGHGMLAATAADTFTPSNFGSGAFASLATGVAIPAADTLIAAMGGVDGQMAAAGLDQARGTAEVWRGLGDVLEGSTGHATAIDALLDALPSHDGAIAALANPLTLANTMTAHWMPDVGMPTMELMASHPDAVAQG